MDGNHPKRKKDKLNPYVLSQEGGRYYISFRDGEGVFHKEQVTPELYALFDRFELEDISYMNAVSRHYAYSDLTEETLVQRAAVQAEPMEEQVFRRLQYDQLHQAILDLPELQQRRLLLYYFEGLTFEQIARMEGCTKRAVKFSVDAAVRKLKEII